MWQLETAATNASSGSTLAGLLMGTGTTDGEADAGTTTPPSKVQVCSREYRPLRKSGPLHFQRIVALCSDIVLARYGIKLRLNRRMAGFPFDVATDARDLARGHRLAAQHRVQRRAQIFARY